MEMPNYPSQSNTPRNNSEEYSTSVVPSKQKEPDTVKKIANAKIKKSKWQEFASAFFEEDIEDVKGYIFKDVFVKGVKDIIFEAFRAFWYPGGGGGRKGNGVRKAHTSYDRYYAEDSIPYRPIHRASPKTSNFSVNNIVFDTRKEAQDVLDEMIDYLMKYEKVSVSRLYDFCGITPPISSNKYGWFNLSGSETVTVEGGYGLRLPDPQPI